MTRSRARWGRVGVALVAAVSAVLALAPGARAADPAQTITAIAASYDVAAGAVSATATLGAPPSPAQDAFLAIYVGQWSGTSCDGKVLLGTFTGAATPAGSWTFVGDSAPARNTDPPQTAGSAVTISVTDPALANQPYDCVWALSLDPADADTEYSRIAGADLTVTAPPPAPTPTPTPTPTPVPVPQGAKLAIAVKGAQPLRRNRWLALRVEVANVGGATARRVRLRATPGKGAAVSKRRIAVGALKSGKSRKVRLRVRARRASGVTLVARSGKVKARERLPLALRGRKPHRPPGRAGLAGRLFTLWEADPMGPGRRTGFAFVDGRWAYRGIPKGGLPVCTTTTAGADADGDPTDGCLPYTYDARRRALKIDGKPASLSTDGARLDVAGDTYWSAPIVKAGTRFTVALKSIAIAGYWPYQVITTSWLGLTAGGEFALSSQTLGSFGLPGTPGSGNFVSIPPDQKGTYQVLSRGRLRLAYADGKVVDRTIAVYRDPQTGSADPATDGLWLDDDPFWKDDDD